MMCDMCGFHTWVGLMRYIVVQMELQLQIMYIFILRVHVYTAFNYYLYAYLYHKYLTAKNRIVINCSMEFSVDIMPSNLQGFML